MNNHASRRAFLVQLGTSAALLGTFCPLAAEVANPGTPSAPGATPAASPESPEIAKLRKQLEAQREGSIKLLVELHAKLGPPVATAIAAYVEERSRERYQKMAVAGDRDLHALKAALWDKLSPAFRWELVEDTPERMRFKVTACPAAEEMKRLRVPAELGYALNCASDPGIAAGINPGIRFSRTQTLMQGNPCCDHCYELSKRV